MEYALLGSTGMTVSRICLGCLSFGSKRWREWMLEPDEAKPVIRHAFDSGITYFDTADFYSLGASETILGEAISGIGIPRDEIVIASKVGMPVGDGPNHRGLSRKHLRHSIDATLKRLGTDYVDLYQMHRLDPNVPMEEIVLGLDDIVRAGKALHVGASSMHAWQLALMIAAADRHGGFRIASMQSHYNLIYREEERELVPLCAAKDVSLLPWSPLARGRLARAPDADATARARADPAADRWYNHDSDAAVIDAVGRVADLRGVARAEVALSWLLHQPAVPSVIIGASRASHIDDACKATALALTPEDLDLLAAPYTPHPVVGHHV